MTDHYADYEALRPVGEATWTPDRELDARFDAQDREESLVGYPAEAHQRETNCPSCGTSIPWGQPKCRFCLAHHLDSSNEQRHSDTELSLLHVVHLFVESSTYYGAVAKGAAAARLLATNGSDPVVDECQLIYDFDEEPAAQVTDAWPALPAALRTTSECGEEVLAVARERTTWGSTAHSATEHTTYLYDESGSTIQDEAHLSTHLEGAGNDGWLVPAIALQHSPVETRSGSQEHSIPTKTSLQCWECGRETTHRFSAIEERSDNGRSGQPIWDCTLCRTPCFGPEPGASQ
jgi:rubrerythrin